jgi:phosphoenolpyruvate synthase/pyruvate phosphate dikinase
MKNLLGGKGANLAEMCRLGIPVPPGFTISTEACTAYTQLGRQQGRDALLAMIDGEVREGVAAIEAEMGKRFGNAADPLLLSVRSGARASMPGMMDTILNLGLNDEAVAGLAARKRQRALRLGQLPPLHPDVRRRGDGPQTHLQGRARPLRGHHRHAQGRNGASSSTPN